MPITKLTNVSFRVVGAYLRINETFNKATVPNDKFDIPSVIDVPAIDVEHDGVAPTIEDYMNSLKPVLADKGLTFDFVGLDDVKNAPRRILSNVQFGAVGNEVTFSLTAGVLQPAFGNTPMIATAWQYYMFDVETGQNIREEVFDRAGFNQTIVKSNTRIIWRLITTYINPESSQAEMLEDLNA